MNKIIISTKFGNVNASATATIIGEGPHCDGFKLTNQPATHTVEQANAEFVFLGTKAEVWAEGEVWESEQ